MDEQENGDETSDMEAVGGGVKTDIAGCHFFCQLFFRARHDILYHPSPFEFFDQVHGASPENLDDKTNGFSSFYCGWGDWMDFDGNQGRGRAVFTGRRKRKEVAVYVVNGTIF